MTEKTTAGRLKKALICLIPAALLVLIDQITKYLAETHLTGGAVPIIPGVFELQFLRNTGAAFSMLEGKQIFFIVLTVAFLVFAFWFYMRIPETRRMRALRICVVFLIAGAVGNLIDRILFRSVRDFFSFVLIHFPIFNVADIYVSVTAVVLFALVIFRYRDEDFSFLKKKKAG